MRTRWIVALSLVLVACEGLGPEAPVPPLATSFDATQPTASPQMCGFVPATIYVGADGLIVGGPDAGQPYQGLLRGTPGPDVIVGTSGADVVRAGGGNDRLCGLAGDDRLNGNAGNDIAFGGEGDDRLTGGDGEDDLLGDAGDDVAVGGGAFDNCDAEKSQGCEWTQPVQLLGCFNGHGWDVIPGTSKAVEAFVGNRPPSPVAFTTLDGALLPASAIAEISTYYTRRSFADEGGPLLTDWLTFAPRLVPAVKERFPTTVTPFAPPESRGQRFLQAYVTAWAPGLVTLVPCSIQMNVLDPRLVPSDVTLTGPAGSTTPISGSLPLIQTGYWSYFSPKYQVEVDYPSGEDPWLSTRVEFYSSVGGTLHLTADASHLSPGTFEARVTLFVPEYPEVPHAIFEVFLEASPLNAIVGTGGWGWRPWTAR